MKRRNISSRCELSGAKRSCSKSATFAFSWSDEDDDAVANEEVAEFLALFFLFRLKGLENLDKHLDEVDIMLDELELLELELCLFEDELLLLFDDFCFWICWFES